LSINMCLGYILGNSKTKCIMLTHNNHKTWLIGYDITKYDTA